MQTSRSPSVGGGPGSSQTTKAVFDIELPDWVWIEEVSRSFPETEFHLLAGIDDDGGALELGEAIFGGADCPAVLDAIRSHSAIDRVNLLFADDSRGVFRYRTTDRTLYTFLRRASLPPEFPMVVVNGWFEVTVTATREQVKLLRDQLEEVGSAYEVLSVVGTDEEDALVTDRQRELLATAMRNGYFEVPRRCSLADVADEFDLDTSTASGVIRRGQSRIVKWYLTGPGGRKYN